MGIEHVVGLIIVLVFGYMVYRTTRKSKGGGTPGAGGPIGKPPVKEQENKQER